MTVKPETLEPLLVTIALFRKALAFGEGVNILVHEDKPEAVPPLARAIYEVSLDIRFLLRSQDPAEGARRMQLTALVDYTEDSWKIRHRLGLHNVRPLIATLRSFRTDFPHLYQELLRQRRRRRFHWSGLSRSRVEQLLSPGSMIYKVFSWEAHCSLSPLSDYSLDPNTGLVEFSPVTAKHHDSTFHAYSVGAMLYYLWNEIADFFSLPAIELPGGIVSLEDGPTPPSR